MAEPKWHPILATVEDSPGVWRMVDTMGRDYGLIRLVRVNGEPAYRCEFRGDLIGYVNTLRSGCERIQWAFIQSGQPGGFAPNPWPETTKSPAPPEA